MFLSWIETKCFHDEAAGKDPFVGRGSTRPYKREKVFPCAELWDSWQRFHVIYSILFSFGSKLMNRSEDAFIRIFQKNVCPCGWAQEYGQRHALYCWRYAYALSLR